MNKRLFAVLAVLVLVVCALPMVVGAETTDCTHANASLKPVNNGKHKYECSDCDTIGWDTCVYSCSMACACGRTAEHVYTRVLEGYDASCFEDGLTDGLACANCDSVQTPQQTIAAPGKHTYVSGVCDVCGDVCQHTRYTTQKITNAEKHWHDCLDCETRQSVPCDFSCSKACECGRIAEHNFTRVLEGYDASCFEDGLTDGLACADCDAVQTPQQTIAAPGKHTYVSGVCDVCGDVCQHTRYTTQKITNAEKHWHDCLDCEIRRAVECDFDCANPCECGRTTEHVFTRVLPAVAPGCTTTGLTQGMACANCDAVETAQQTIPVNGHSDPANYQHDENGHWYICTNPNPDGSVCGEEVGVAEHDYKGWSCTTDGTCLCGRVKKAAHTTEDVAAKAATCEEAGNKAGVKCTKCTYTTVKTIKALGHKWGEGVIVKEATEYETGLKVYTCQNDATHTLEEATPVLAHYEDPRLDRVPRTGYAFIEWLYALIAA